MKIVYLLSFILFSSPSFAAVYDMPLKGNDIVGENKEVAVKYGDNLTSLSQRYGVSWYKIWEANPSINPNNQLKAGQKILIPAMHILPRTRKGVVINVSELQLYYFTPDGKKVFIFPVGLGRKNWRTPLGSTYVTEIKEQPTWHVPKSIQRYHLEKFGETLPDEVPPGKENPLGEFAIFLKKRGVLIHGNNDPWSVGRYISSGCIRLYAKDIEALHHLVQEGTPVHFVNYPIKSGWLDNVLYLKAQIPLYLEKETDEYQNDSPQLAIKEVTKKRTVDIDWKKVKQIVFQARGIPVEIGEMLQKKQKRIPIPVKKKLVSHWAVTKAQKIDQLIQIK